MFGDIFKIVPLNLNIGGFNFKQGAPITVKKATVKPFFSLSFFSQTHNAIVYHSSGLIIVPSSNFKELIRIETSTGHWSFIRYLEFPVSIFVVLRFVHSIIGPSSIFETLGPAFKSMVFLRDGRLMVGSCNGFYLLEEVPVPTNERWVQARIVATANLFPACHSICLTPYDNILAFCDAEYSRNIVFRQLFIE